MHFQVGVTLMIMLSGMHIDFEHLKKVGKQAVGVAVIGTLFPIGMGVVTMVVFGVDAFPDALSAGITLGPTSVGIAIQLLTERKVLSSEYGQVSEGSEVCAGQSNQPTGSTTLCGTLFCVTTSDDFGRGFRG